MGEKTEKDNVSPGQTTPSDSVYQYRLDAEKVQHDGVEVERERKSLDVGIAAGAGEGVPVSYDLATGEEAKKHIRG